MSGQNGQEIKKTTPQRRQFMKFMAQSLGLGSLGALVLSGYVWEARKTSLVLRPPGAQKEMDFVRLCIKCGHCVLACPYDTLMLARAGEDIPIGTPYFIPNNIPCYMCPSVPCVAACPTKALDPKILYDDSMKMDIKKSQMGVAVVDEKSCVAYWGLQCDVCYRACPLLDQAIFLEYRRNERTGKHAFLIPKVNSDICTGCGKCEYACITAKPAIFVLPRNIALGDIGDHYIKGFEDGDEARILNSSGQQKTITKRSEKSPQDYLNSEEF